MGHKIELYSLPPAQVAKVRKRDSVDAIRERCEEHGELLSNMEFADATTEMFEALDVILGTTHLADLLGAELGDFNGLASKPRVGHLGGDEITDAVDSLEQLAEALELDADEDEDYEGGDLIGLRNHTEQVADEHGFVVDDDFADMVNELIDILRAAIDEERDLVSIVSDSE